MLAYSTNTGARNSAFVLFKFPACLPEHRGGQEMVYIELRKLTCS